MDTGLGVQDIEHPMRRLGWGSNWTLRPVFKHEETAFHQIRKLNFSTKDVRHILLTHLDLDHAGGLSDFPWAKVHVMRQEYEAVSKPKTLLERFRYRLPQFEHFPQFVRYEAQGDRWMGFEAVRPLKDFSEDIFFVPLHGHTRGHAAVGVKTDQGWLLHAGDAYFYRGEINPEKPHCPEILTFFQRRMAHDNTLRRKNQALLRQLAKEKGAEVNIFCAHDPVEMERFKPDAPDARS